MSNEMSEIPGSLKKEIEKLGIVDKLTYDIILISYNLGKQHMRKEMLWKYRGNYADDFIKEMCAREIERPYSEDIFTPLTENEVKLACEAANNAVQDGSDRLHAQWARHWVEILRSTDLEDLYERN